MAKWDLNKLPEGRRPLPDSWFREKAMLQERMDRAEETLLSIAETAEISEGTDWYAMMARKAIEELKGVE